MDIENISAASVGLIFPHQLFKLNPLFEACDQFILIEEYLLFRQYNFHKQKIAFHRASMKAYESYLSTLGKTVYYVDSMQENSDIRKLIPQLSKLGITHIHYTDTVDDWLEKRLRRGAQEHDITLLKVDSPLFLNTYQDLNSFFHKGKKKFFQTKFYIEQRKRLGILMDGDSPAGGKWSYDAENRKKYPRGKIPTAIIWPDENNHYREAWKYVEQHFSDNIGVLNKEFRYPIEFQAAEAWLYDFLKQRFSEFGDYEDAMVAGESILNHSVLSPLLNIGMITPDQLLIETIKAVDRYNIPINSAEGFIRQIIGWREFIRGVYISKGVEERTKNFWGFTRKIPSSFYTGNTGIDPVDEVINRVLETGYCHHIERLMVLGNFMCLCEFDPDDVYRWFMELFIDAYDWVMVPNVYGMSQFADGGLMSTKPYISGSNYVLKMSNYNKGPWCEIWDGLFWRFLDVNREFFKSNPRTGFLLNTLDRMDSAKREKLSGISRMYLDSLE